VDVFRGFNRFFQDETCADMVPKPDYENVLTEQRSAFKKQAERARLLPTPVLLSPKTFTGCVDFPLQRLNAFT
jgi:hypothetical protein